MASAENLTIAVVGATGEVGQQMLSILEERNFPGTLRAFASERSAGQPVSFRGQEHVIENTITADYTGVDLALFSAGANVSRELAPRVVAAGALVIDNSSAWRKDRDVPLVVAEVNPTDLRDLPRGIVANPNCTTMIAMPVLAPLHNFAFLSSFKATTFQAVSGAGRKGVDELGAQLYELRESVDNLVSGNVEILPQPEVFNAPIAFNVVPVNGDMEGDDTTEELKLRDESRRILNLARLSVSATCVRVPVVTGHSLSINARFELPISSDEARNILGESPCVMLSDMPTPLEAAGKDEVFVGRIRNDPTETYGLAMFIAGDNLRKGAALNAVQIAELLLPRILSS